MPAGSPLRSHVGTIMLLIAIATILGASLSYVFNPRHIERYTLMEQRLHTIQQKNVETLRQNIRLDREIRACKHDERYLYRIARHELGMIKKSHSVYLF